jgi:hypothetical protein
LWIGYTAIRQRNDVLKSCLKRGRHQDQAPYENRRPHAHCITLSSAYFTFRKKVVYIKLAGQWLSMTHHCPARAADKDGQLSCHLFVTGWCVHVHAAVLFKTNEETILFQLFHVARFSPPNTHSCFLVPL